MRNRKRYLDMMDSGGWYNKYDGLMDIVSKKELTTLEIIQYIGIEKVENELRKLNLKKLKENG